MDGILTIFAGIVSLKLGDEFPECFDRFEPMTTHFGLPAWTGKPSTFGAHTPTIC
jgi:hypothetical protein